MLQRKTAGSRSSLTAMLFVPWRFLVSLVFTPTCVWQRAHHLVFFLVLADQQLTAGSKVLYNSVHYKLDMYKHIHLQNCIPNTPVFEKKLTTEHKPVLCKRIFSRRYFRGDKEWSFLPREGCCVLLGHSLAQCHLELTERFVHGFLGNWRGPFCPL